MLECFIHEGGGGTDLVDQASQARLRGEGAFADDVRDMETTGEEKR